MLEIYERAMTNGCSLEATCSSIPLSKWEDLMAGAKRACKKTITRILINQDYIDRDWARLMNPYHFYRTDTHLIYVHSGIEHFFRVN